VEARAGVASSAGAPARAVALGRSRPRTSGSDSTKRSSASPVPVPASASLRSRAHSARSRRPPGNLPAPSMIRPSKQDQPARPESPAPTKRHLRRRLAVGSVDPPPPSPSALTPLPPECSSPVPPQPPIQRTSRCHHISRAGLPERNMWRAGSPARLPTTRSHKSPVFSGAGAGAGIRQSIRRRRGVW
jgi:hypothetical protein